jgi:8-oxo-dGTP pyrophosphatase MutT (NUDIX family)
MAASISAILQADKSNRWQLLSSKEVYRNPWIAVREDQVVRPDGQPGIYGVVNPKIATGVAALTEGREIYLVGQYRYPTQVYSWEIIEGGAEPGEAPEIAAKRELEEEAGLVAESFSSLGGVAHLSNCYTSEQAYFYLARHLKEVSKKPDPTEVLTVIKLPFKEALELLKSGEIKDAITVIALYRVDALIREGKL